MNEIETSVASMLEKFGVTMTAVYKGVKANALGGKTEMDSWSVAFSKSDGREVFEEFDYYTGTGHRSKVEDSAAGRFAAQHLKGASRNSLAWESLRKQYCKPVAPHAAAVLQCLLMDTEASSTSFHNWCDEFGYDDDSIKARETYDACQENSDKLHRIFAHAQIEELREALQDY
jgi:hypothetical protein